MSDIHAQTLQLATALKEVFPELTFQKDPNSGIVTILGGGLSITVSPSQGTLNENYDDPSQEGQFSPEELRAAAENPTDMKSVMSKRVGLKFGPTAASFNPQNFISGHTPKSIHPNNAGGNQASEGLKDETVRDAYMVEVGNMLLRRIPQLAMFKRDYITRPQGKGVMFGCWWADGHHTDTHRELGVQASIPVTLSVKVLFQPRDGHWYGFAETHLSEIYAGSFDEHHPDGLLPDLHQSFHLSELKPMVEQLAVRVREFVAYAEHKNGPLRKS